MGLFDARETRHHIDAIVRYFNTQPINTPAAKKLRVEFVAWHNNLGYFDKISDATAQQASNRRNAFNVANAESAAEAEAVKELLVRGVTREEMKGQPRIADSAGNYPRQKGITVASAASKSISYGARPTIRKGSKGEAVKAWQTIIGVTADGSFGPNTEKITKNWQKEHGLVADGVVGAASWSAALGGKSAPKMSLEEASLVPVAPLGTAASFAPTGTVAQLKSISVPKPAKPAKRAPLPLAIAASKPVKTAKVTPSQSPAVAAISAPSGFPKPATIAKAAGGTLAAGVAIGLIKKLLF